MTKHRWVAAAFVCGALAAFPRAAEGQGLRDMLSDVFVFGDCGVPLCMDHEFAETGSVFTEHGRHYLADRSPINGQLLSFFQDGVSSVVTAMPTPAFDGGRIWSSEDEVSSFGPTFAERGETLGAGRFFIGVLASGMKFTNFNGVPAEALELNFVAQDTDGTDSIPSLGTPISERDVLQVRTAVDMELTMATLVASAGLTSFLDVGVVVPVIRTRLDAVADAQILAADPTHPHRFGGTSAEPELQRTNTVSGSATGVGDITARMKISMTGGTPSQGAPEGLGVAVVGDVTFATGQEEDYLGLGEMRARVMAVISGRAGSFFPRFNAGYLRREGADTNDAFVGTLGFDVLAASRLSIGADVVGQWEFQDPTDVLPGPVTFVGAGGATIDPTTIPDRSRSFADLVVGMKFLLGADMVLVTNALVPVRSVGLRPDLMWTLGLQGTFR